MFELDATVAAAIFFSSFFLDLIAARYTSDVVSLRAGRAASLSFLWHMLSAIVVIEYAHNAYYILFVCLGGGLGTYFTIWSTRRARSAGAREDAIAEIAVPAGPDQFAVALPRSRIGRSISHGIILRRCARPRGRAHAGSTAARHQAGRAQDCVYEGPRVPL
jgi:hypothetical protein